jgi:hypothetical protein
MTTPPSRSPLQHVFDFLELVHGSLRAVNVSWFARAGDTKLGPAHARFVPETESLTAAQQLAHGGAQT